MYVLSPFVSVFDKNPVSAEAPNATEFVPNPFAPGPTAVALVAVVNVLSPIAIEVSPFTWAFPPKPTE